jgi:hypothetical protein
MAYSIGMLGALNEGLVHGSREPGRRKISARAMVETDASLGDMSDTMEARHSLTVWFSQRVTKAEWDNEDFRLILRKQAARSITRHILNGLDGKLYDALEALWSEGLHDHPATEIIKEILDAVKSGK